MPLDILTHFHRNTSSLSAAVDEVFAGETLTGVRFKIPALTGLIAFLGVVGSLAMLITKIFSFELGMNGFANRDEMR